jgi:hypothetical protein
VTSISAEKYARIRGRYIDCRRNYQHDYNPTSVRCPKSILGIKEFSSEITNAKRYLSLLFSDPPILPEDEKQINPYQFSFTELSGFLSRMSQKLTIHKFMSVYRLEN